MGAKSLAELRAQPAEAIQKAGRGSGPVVDGYLIREDPGKVFAAGKQIDVPVLTGSNRDESFGGNPKSAADFVEQARTRFGDLADAYLKLYPADSDEQARESAFYSGRDEMAFVMRNWARLADQTGQVESVRVLLHRAAAALAERAWAVRARAAWQRHARLGDSLRIRPSG